MNTREYVESLFGDYEKTESLGDFMEELEANLDARIENLVKKGFSDNEAFDKARAELGDVSVLADELSLKKRREVFEEVYMDTRKYMSTGRVAAYVSFGVVAAFGVLAAFISGLATGGIIGKIAFSGSIMPFLVAAITGFTFLGLTQETKSRYPMSGKRAAWYTLAVGLISFGIAIIPITYFSVQTSGTPFGTLSAVSVLIPFVLPGGGLLSFLLMTEQRRLKPWVVSAREDGAQKETELRKDPAAVNRFGMFSGAIWFFAAALFILFGFLAGFRFSWVVFVFAMAAQLLVQGLMIKKSPGAGS